MERALKERVFLTVAHNYRCRKCKHTFMEVMAHPRTFDECPKCGHLYWDWLNWPQVEAMKKKTVPVYDKTDNPEEGPVVGEAVLNEDGTAAITLDDSPESQAILKKLTQAQPVSISSRGTKTRPKKKPKKRKRRKR